VLELKDTYPFNFYSSKLFTWYLKRSITTLHSLSMFPVLTLDAYLKTCKALVTR